MAPNPNNDGDNTERDIPVVIAGYSMTTDFGGANPTGPYLLPPDWSEVKEGDPLALQFWGMEGPHYDSSGTCDVSADSGDFSLTWGDFNLQGNKPVTAAVVGVKPDNVWSADPAKRALLLQSFRAFQKSLEALEDNGCLAPGCARLMANRIAGALPLTVDEQLVWNYGFSPDSRYIDLEPGMRLTLQVGSYQYVAPPGYAGGGLNAYTASGSLSIFVSQGHGGKLQFNYFMGQMTPFQVSDLLSPIEASNELDFMAAGTQRRYARLVYPAQFHNVRKISQSPQAYQNVALIFADNLTDLETATQEYLNGGQLSTPGTADQPPQIVFFSGRTTINPEIQVFVMDNPIYVPVGAKVRDLFFQYISPSDGQLAKLENFILTRWNQSPKFGNKGNPKTLPPYTANTINFEDSLVWVDAGGNKISQFDLPLLKGDSLTWSAE